MSIRTPSIVSAAACALLLLPIASHSGPERNIRNHLAIGAINRSYELHLPAGYTGRIPVPLVVVLHGSNASGMIIRVYTRFNESADQHNFIVVYPDSYGEYWNDGRIDMNSFSFKANIDDVKFISVLIDHIRSRYRVDRTRVYIVGFSNGGMMALRCVVTIPEKLAAAACVSGSLPKHLSLVKPAMPVPVLLIHGTDDPVVPWAGGKLERGDSNHGKVLSVLDNAIYWADQNQCIIRAGVRLLPDLDPDDGTLVFQMTYECLKPGSEVVLLAIQGGGHTWPGALQSLPGNRMARTCRDIDATEFIWEFFSRHRRL